jgi:hypothetical protein
VWCVVVNLAFPLNAYLAYFAVGAWCRHYAVQDISSDADLLVGARWREEMEKPRHHWAFEMPG